MRLAPFILLLLFCLPLRAAYDLNATLQYALSHSPVLKEAHQRTAIAGWERANARNRFLPSLDLESQHGIAWTRPTPSLNEPWMSSANLKLTETLYDNGESLTLWQQSKSNEILAELNNSQIRDKLILSLVQSYYDYCRHHYLMEARAQQKELYDKQNSETTLDYRQGLKTKKDYLRFKAQAQKAAIDQRAEKTALTKTAIKIAELMGLSQQEAPEFEVIPTEKLQLNIPEGQPKVENVPDYKISLQAATLKGYDVSLAKRKNLPVLNLSALGNYGYADYLGSKTSFANTKQYNAQVVLGLHFNVWDWGTRSNEIEKANANLRIAEHQLAGSRLAAQTTIQNLMLDLQELTQNRQITLELLKNQEAAYQLIRRDYEEGRVPYIDLVQSLQDLFDAKALHYNAHYLLAQAIAQYEYLEGKIYETIPH